VKYPKIFLAIDNCFAIKRWVEPSEWLKIIKDIGIDFVEASTDNECDPIFSTRDYLDDWIREVIYHCEKNKMKVVNFFTGYQTYRTVGLAHYDKRIIDKIINDWFKVIIEQAAKIDAGIGFSFFAIPNRILQNPIKYKEKMKDIIEILVSLVEYSSKKGGVKLSVEQMYSPHQPPWTIEGSKAFLKSIYKLCNKPVYITIDIGHQCGQKKFRKMNFSEIKQVLANFKMGKNIEDFWLGPDIAYQYFFELVNNEYNIENFMNKLNEIMDKYPYMFSEIRDGDTYKWLEELACFSPIIHMQQTDGFSSKHLPFTRENNLKGIIEGKKLLHAIAKSYEYNNANEDFPPKVDEIYLTFEIFSSNIDSNYHIINNLKETLEYWRKFIPMDGITLDKLL